MQRAAAWICMGVRLAFGGWIACTLASTSVPARGADGLSLESPDEAVLFVRAPVPEQTSDDRALVERMAAAWAGQRGEIAACDIRYRLFRSEVAGERTFDEFEAALARHDLSADRDALRRFIEDLNGGAFRADPPWSECRLLVSASRLRSDQGPFSFVEVDDIRIHHDPRNLQFNVHNRGSRGLAGDDLSSLRRIPTSDQAAVGLIVLRREDGLVELGWRDPQDPLSIAPPRMTVDEATGVVVARSQPDAGGARHTEFRFLDLTTFGDDITFPRAAVQARFSGDRLRMIAVHVLDELRFNEPVPDSAFQLAGRAGHVIVDCRDAKRAWPLPENTDDLARWLRTASPPTPLAAAARLESGSRNWLWLLNGVGCLAIGIALWRRRGTPPPEPDATRDANRAHFKSS
ncbi:MAG: hypothetical protein KF774_08400 [Planctomyces sp.]|nr:hypothetical protein [Planctomyces sp.]